MYNKYSEEVKEETTIYILESGKSITAASKELEINVHTACRWINQYKKKHALVGRDGVLDIKNSTSWKTQFPDIKQYSKHFPFIYNDRVMTAEYLENVWDLLV